MQNGNEQDPAIRPARTRPAPDEHDGIDLSLIRWMLSLTPGERLALLQDQANAILELRPKL